MENLFYNELLYRGYDVKIGKTYKDEIDFGAFDSVRDPSPKYVFILDEYDMLKDGIAHLILKSGF